MTDVVWMKLTAIHIIDGERIEDMEHFMFGPTGITQFKPNSVGETVLFNHKGIIVETVKENQDLIFDFIAKVRGFHAKQSKKANRTRKTQKK